MAARIFIGGLKSGVHRSELEKEFNSFGSIRDVWVARNPPGFGFIIYDDQRDADDAIREMDGRSVFGAPIRVERAKGPNNKRSSEKCYTCGKGGHRSNDCRSRMDRNYRRSRTPPRRYNRRSYSRSRSRSRDRYQRRRSVSRDRRDDNRSRKNDRRSRSRSNQSDRRSRSKHSDRRSRSKSNQSDRRERSKSNQSDRKSRSKSNQSDRRSRSKSHQSDKRSRSRSNHSDRKSRSPDRKSKSPVRNWADENGDVDYNEKLNFTTESEKSPER